MEINYLAAFVASLTGPVLGTLWYSVLFAKSWQHLSGVSEQVMKKNMPKLAFFSYLLTLFMSINLAAFIGKDQSPLFGLIAGFAAGFGWVAISIGINYLFEQKPLKLYLINAGYFTVLLSIMGLIIGSM